MHAAAVAQRKQLSAIQVAALRQRRAAVIVIEGYDASGKGGVIRELTYAMDPRGFRLHPIGAPTALEAFRPFMWRFWSRLPEPGQLAIFDRSWYGRVLVERVEHGLPDADYAQAFIDIDAFEETLLDQQIPVVKFFLDIPAAVQRTRLLRRAQVPEKRWKLTVDDLNAWAHREAYEQAIEVMLARPQRAPWTRVDACHKPDARAQVLSTVVEALSGWLDEATTAYQPGVHARLHELDP